jgi:hypothetical protein
MLTPRPRYIARGWYRLAGRWDIRRCNAGWWRLIDLRTGTVAERPFSQCSLAARFAALLTSLEGRRP